MCTVLESLPQCFTYLVPYADRASSRSGHLTQQVAAHTRPRADTLQPCDKSIYQAPRCFQMTRFAGGAHFALCAILWALPAAAQSNSNVTLGTMNDGQNPDDQLLYATSAVVYSG